MGALITREGLERLDAALAHIDAHPEEWFQRNWALRESTETLCGTSYCLAGWIVVLAGGEPDWYRIGDEDDRYWDEAASATLNGERHTISRHARELLGMDYAESSALWDGNNDRARLTELRDRLAASLDGDSAILGRSE